MLLRLSSGSAETQGRRVAMEDAHTHLDDLKKERKLFHNHLKMFDNFQNLAFYAVYDGHGGVLFLLFI